VYSVHCVDLGRKSGGHNKSGRHRPTQTQVNAFISHYFLKYRRMLFECRRKSINCDFSNCTLCGFCRRLNQMPKPTRNNIQEIEQQAQTLGLFLFVVFFFD